jgi:hypothetical protein
MKNEIALAQITTFSPLKYPLPPSTGQKSHPLSLIIAEK